MKIVFIINEISRAAGTERVVCGVANFLSREGYKTEIVSLCTNPSDKPFYKLDKTITVKHCGLASYTGEHNGIGKLCKKVINTLKIGKLMKSLHGDIFIGTGKNINMYMATYLKSDIPRIGWEHFHNSANISSIIKFARRIMYKKLSALVVLTEDDSRYYKNFLRNVHVIPNAAPFFPKVTSTLKNKRIISVGRLEWEKDFDLLIDAFYLASRKCPEWRLDILGDGVLRNHLDNKINKLGLCDKVRIHDPVANIESEYINSSLLVVSSKFESFSMAILEAMACGVPTISIDCPVGPRSLIKHNISGILVKDRSPNKLSEELISMMLNNEKRVNLAKNARAEVEKYTEEQIGGLWIRLLDSLLCKIPK